MGLGASVRLQESHANFRTSAQHTSVGCFHCPGHKPNGGSRIEATGETVNRWIHWTHCSRPVAAGFSSTLFNNWIEPTSRPTTDPSSTTAASDRFGWTRELQSVVHLELEASKSTCCWTRSVHEPITDRRPLLSHPFHLAHSSYCSNSEIMFRASSPKTVGLSNTTFNTPTIEP
jgi:hypothetical protein